MKEHETPRDGPAWHAGTWDDVELSETYRYADDGTWHFSDRASNLERVHFDRPPLITPIA